MEIGGCGDDVQIFKRKRNKEEVGELSRMKRNVSTRAVR